MCIRDRYLEVLIRCRGSAEVVVVQVLIVQVQWCRYKGAEVEMLRC